MSTQILLVTIALSLAAAIGGLLVYILRRRHPGSVAARDAWFENSSEAMLALDAGGRLADFNPAMQALLEVPLAPLLGRPAGQALAAWPELTAQLGEAAKLRVPIRLERAGKTASFDLRISRFTDRAGRSAGRLLILRDTSERQRLEDELESYTHTAAHDLRTPLSSIVGYSSMVEEMHRGMKPEEVDQRMEDITRLSFKAANMLDGLLLLSKVRTTDPVPFEPLDTAVLIARVRERLKGLIAGSGAEIVLPELWPPASGCAPWVEEVWTQYISNAIRYGGQPARLELGAAEEPGGVRFWVRDNGPGLDEAQRSRLFVPFERLHASRTRGHGLGLSIVQRILAKLGGTAGVESEPGKGSTFYFVLPNR